jgi:hypothetical protein
MQLTGATNLERTNTSPRYSEKMNELGYQISDDDHCDNDDGDGCNDFLYGAAFLLNRESHRWPINFPPFMKVESTLVC